MWVYEVMLNGDCFNMWGFDFEDACENAQLTTEEIENLEVLYREYNYDVRSKNCIDLI